MPATTPNNFQLGDRVTGETPLGATVTGIVKIIDRGGLWLDVEGGDPLAWSPVRTETAVMATSVTTDDQDRTLEDIFARADVLTLDVEVRDTVAFAMDQDDRMWVVREDGELADATRPVPALCALLRTPKGLAS